MTSLTTILATILDAAARKIAVVASIIAIGLLAVLFFSWRDSRETQSHLQETVSAAKKTISDATERESARDAQLKQTLATIIAAKQSVKTAAQAAAAIPAALPNLPEPIEIEMPEASAGAGTDAAAISTSLRESSIGKSALSANASAHVSPNAGAIQTALEPAIARIPQADLKPLFDAAENCRACEAKLAAAQSDLSDQAAKLAATSTERDAAIKAAKGGSIWTRLKRSAKWLIIGAAAGALAARAIH